jgi:hypothetical protein
MVRSPDLLIPEAQAKLPQSQAGRGSIVSLGLFAATSLSGIHLGLMYPELSRFAWLCNYSKRHQLSRFCAQKSVICFALAIEDSLMFSADGFKTRVNCFLNIFPDLCTEASLGTCA